MHESTAETRPRLISGRYRIVPGPTGDWRVVDPSDREVFAGQGFSTANEAGNALVDLATQEGLDCLMMTDRRRHIMREAIIGEAAKQFMEEGCVVLSLNVSQELDANLDNMGEELGVPKGETILKALSLLKVAMDAKREGKRVAILDDRDDSEQEIVGF
jgi:hypothetical protein